MHPVIRFEADDKEMKEFEKDILWVKRALQVFSKDKNIWKKLKSWRQKYLFQRFCKDAKTIVAIGKAGKAGDYSGRICKSIF